MQQQYNAKCMDRLTDWGEKEKIKVKAISNYDNLQPHLNAAVLWSKAVAQYSAIILFINQPVNSLDIQL